MVQFYTESIRSFFGASIPADFGPTEVSVIPVQDVFHLLRERLEERCVTNFQILARENVEQSDPYTKELKVSYFDKDFVN